jgi:regulator of sigma E protease
MILLLSVLWTLVLLSILIVIHEFGHFLAAKLLGVHVEEFALGFPPRVKKLFTWWNTPFVLNSIPIGGYVRLFGDDSETLEQLNEVQQSDHLTDAQAFRFKPIWARLIILLAGVAVNFVFGVLCFSLVSAFKGIPEVPTFPVILAEVSVDSPAAVAGLQVGDRIFGAGDTFESVVQIHDTQKLIDTINEIPDSSMFLVYERDGKVMDQEVILREPSAAGRLGVKLQNTVEFRFYPWYEMPIRGTVVGVQDSLALGKLILNSLGTMVSGIFTRGQVPTDLKGPIGIIEETHKSGILQEGWSGSVTWLGLISVNLAIMNLLPLPVLDGGRSIFLLLEPILGRKRRLAWEQRANGVGMVFLLGLFVIISVSDVWGLVKGLAFLR